MAKVEQELMMNKDKICGTHKLFSVSSRGQNGEGNAQQIRRVVAETFREATRVFSVGFKDCEPSRFERTVGVDYLVLVGKYGGEGDDSIYKICYHTYSSSGDLASTGNDEISIVASNMLEAVRKFNRVGKNRIAYSCVRTDKGVLVA